MYRGRRRLMSDHAFWQYSLDRYGRKGVPEICLSLQDERGADVNLVLFALWLAQEGRSLGPEDAEECMAAVRDWHGSVVVPMRGVRRWLKDRDVEDTLARDRLRDAVKTWEIEAERMEQDMLFRLTRDGSLAPDRDARPVAARMAANLAAVGVACAPQVNRLIELCL